MARDDRNTAVKQKWADWINARLAERTWTAADLVTASGGILIYGTVYNWTKATARATAEICLIVAAALNTDPKAPEVTPSDVLRAASYPILADAMESKGIRLPGAPTDSPNAGLLKILADKDLTDEVKAVMIRWWQERLADDEARRVADAKRMIEMQQNSA